MRWGNAKTSLAILGLLVVSVAGCGQDLQFTLDRRVEIVSPEDLTVVSIPFDVQWTSELPAGQRFALFVGKSAIAPGKSLRSVAKDDHQCMLDPDCPDPEHLARYNVFVTDQTSVTVNAVPELERGSTIMTAELVLIDDDGYREGESAWFVTFKPKFGTDS